MLRLTTSGLGLVVAVYTVAAYRPRWEAIVSTVAVAVVVVVGTLAMGAPQFTMANLVVLVAATALGDRTRVARDRALALEERARELEQEREERLRLAVDAERTRIARELHDITARDGLAEMRQAVTLLRDGTQEAKPQGDVVQPPGDVAQPGSQVAIGDQITVEANYSAELQGPIGLTVTAIEEGSPADLKPYDLGDQTVILTPYYFGDVGPCDRGDAGESFGEG